MSFMSILRNLRSLFPQTRSRPRQPRRRCRPQVELLEDRRLLSVANAAADFSAASNPNGDWQYGWSHSLGGAFLRDAEPRHIGGVHFWMGNVAGDGNPSVSHNGTDSPITLVGTVNWQAGQLAFHPGPNGEYAVIRWTAPRAGAVAVTAAFAGIDFAGPTTDVHVLHEGAALFDGAVTGFSAGPSFAGAQAVLAGDTIDFAVGFGGNGAFYSDTTALEAVVGYRDGPTLTQPLPALTVNEDAINTVFDPSAFFDDAEDGPSGLAYAVVANTNPGILTAISMAGLLTLEYAPDANGTAEVTVRATDSHGQSLDAAFTVTVLPVNDAPAFTGGPDQSVSAGAGPQTLAGWATDVSAGPTDEAGQALTFRVSTDNLALFAAPPVIEAAGTLTYAPAPNAGGTATLTVWLEDDGGTANQGRDASAGHTLTITVRLEPHVAPVQIDVRRRAINVGKNGVVTVNLLSTAAFNAAQVDVGTVLFVGAAPFRSRLRDVDCDGDLDLVLRFRLGDTGLREVYEQLLADADQDVDGRLDQQVSLRQRARVSLTGRTLDTGIFEGSDEVVFFLAGKALRQTLGRLALENRI